MKAIVVLGAAVWPNGPSPALIRRCKHAAAVWFMGDHDCIIVCGGIGKHPPSEANVMAQFLHGLDIPTDAIHLEDTSTTTLENLARTLPILDRLNCLEITIVTDGYHTPRARLVAKTLGLHAVTSAPSLRGAHLPTQMKQHIREGFALPAYALRLWALRWRGRL